MIDGSAIGLLLSLRRPAEAERLVRDLLAQSPDWSEGYSYLARCLMEGIPARLDEALRVARFGAAQRPFDPWTLEVLGCVLQQLGHTEEAAEIFRDALRVSPFDSFARVKLGELALARNMPLAALDLIHDGLANDPINPQLLGLKAEAELLLQNTEPAAEAIELALRHHPNEPHLHYLCGRVHAAQADRLALPGCLPHLEKAARFYAQAARLAPYILGYQAAYENMAAQVGWACASAGVFRAPPANMDDQLERIRQREARLTRRTDEEWQSEFEAAASLSEDDLLTSQPLNWTFEEPLPGEEYQTLWQKRCNRMYQIGMKIMLWVIVIFLVLSFLASLLK